MDFVPNLYKRRDDKMPGSTYLILPESIDYSVAPPKIKWRAPIKSITTGIGHNSWFMGMKSSPGWKPGQYRNSPCIHLSSELVTASAPETVVQTSIYYSRLKRYVTFPICKLGGHVALRVSPSTDNYLGVPARDPKAEVALMRAVAESKSASADVGMMLAESAETLQMLVSPMKALPKLLKALKHPRKRLSPKAALEYASSAWLTERYGIMPTLSDIDALRNLNNKRLSRYGDLKRVRRGYESEISSSNTRFYGNTSMSPVYLWGQRSIRTSQHVTATFFHRAVLNGGADLGVDFSQIVPLAYELVPYSFVLDWFIDVGSWLRAISPHPGIMPIGTSASTMVQEQTSTSITHACYASVPSSIYPITPLHNSCTQVRRSYTRGIGITLPETPPVMVNLESWKRRLDAVTLTFQRIKR